MLPAGRSVLLCRLSLSEFLLPPTGQRPEAFPVRPRVCAPDGSDFQPEFGVGRQAIQGKVEEEATVSQQRFQSYLQVKD